MDASMALSLWTIVCLIALSLDLVAAINADGWQARHSGLDDDSVILFVAPKN